MRFPKYAVALFCLNFIIATNCIQKREVADNIENVFYLTRKLSSYPKKNDYYKSILNGNSIVPKNTCERSPCKNGGICVATPSGYLCQCQKGYMGTTCAISLLANDPRTRIPSKPDHLLRFLLASTAIAIGFILLIFCWCYVAVERKKLEEQRLSDIEFGLKPANSPSVNLCEACFQLVSRILPGCCADEVTRPVENTTALCQIMEAVAKEKEMTGQDIGRVLQSESFINKFMEEKEQHPTEESENKPIASTADINQQLTASKTKLKSHPDLTTIDYQTSDTSHNILGTKMSSATQHRQTSNKSLTGSLTTKTSQKTDLKTTIGHQASSRYYGNTGMVSDKNTSHTTAMHNAAGVDQDGIVDNTALLKTTSVGGEISLFRSIDHYEPNINHNMYVALSQDHSYIQSDHALIFKTRNSYTENEPKLNTSRVMPFNGTPDLTQDCAESSTRQTGFLPPPGPPQYSNIKYTRRIPKVSLFNPNRVDDDDSD